MLLDDNFEESEAIYPYYRLIEAGHKVTVVGPAKGAFHGKHGYPMNADKGPRGVNAKRFKALVIPGGQAPDKLRTNAQMVKIVKDAAGGGLVVGAICHGAQMLIEADVVRGKKATCYKSVKTDLINAGADYKDKEVVVDGELITSRHPGDLPAFMKAIVEKLEK